MSRLERSQLPEEPLDLFRDWYRAVGHAGFIEPTAMVLATADARGRPSARVVLLKGLDERGFVFYTNYGSRKGRELAENPHAALTFWWDLLERQVRVEGTVEQLPAEESDAYFAGRPRASRIGAHASDQSRPLASRDELEAHLAEQERRFDGEEVPRPEHWGGFLLDPQAIEFWQQGEFRLHDRFRYERSEGGWRLERLAP